MQIRGRLNQMGTCKTHDACLPACYRRVQMTFKKAHPFKWCHFFPLTCFQCTSSKWMDLFPLFPSRFCFLTTTIKVAQERSTLRFSPGFRSQPWHRLSWNKYFVVWSSSCCSKTRIFLSSNDLSFLRSFQIVLRLSSQYFDLVKTSLNKP